jgi:carbon-monoxide dehydrogenase large subunit
MAAKRYFGTSVPRVEDERLISGRGRYVDDLVLPGMVHAAFVRSPHAHARVKSIATDEARAVTGVVAVFTLSDLGPAAAVPLPEAAPAPVIRHQPPMYALANGAVRYVGETVVMVLAESRAIAEDAADLVLVDYEPLPAVANWRTGLDEGAPTAYEGAPDNLAARLVAKFGDADGIFASAPHVFSETFELHRGGCHSMECRGVVARPDSFGGRLELWTSSQSPYIVRRLVARMLGREESAVRVVAPDVGGGFGPKAVVYSEEYAVALASIALDRPVKWIEDRREHFVATTQQRDQLWRLEVAADAKGRMLAVRGRCLHDNGAYLPYGLILAGTATGSFPGPYALQALDLTLDVIFTNMVPNTPVRGACRPNACFVLERLADRVARELGIDRGEVRRRSFVQMDQFPYKTGLMARDGKPVMYDEGDHVDCLDTALAAIGTDFAQRQAEARRNGRHIGLGIGSFIEDTGLAPFEGATVRVQPSGRVLLQTGAAAQGQGHATIFAQICADALGVRPQDVTVQSADTSAFPVGIATIASRVAVTGGASVHVASYEVRAKAIKVAAEMLEVAEGDLVLEDGAVKVPGSDVKVPLGQIAARLEGAPGIPMPVGVTPTLASTAYFEVRQNTYSHGTSVCEVEVDIETGHVEILRYVVVHDCGTLINPMLVEGQIRGGVVHGIGNALFERMVYDDQGQPLTTTYGDYLLPTAPEMPRIEIIHRETPSTRNPIGVKGAGESGTIPAAACVISAIEDALAPFGARISHHPISPSDIVDIIQNKEFAP